VQQYMNDRAWRKEARAFYLHHTEHMKHELVAKDPKIKCSRAEVARIIQRFQGELSRIAGEEYELWKAALLEATGKDNQKALLIVSETYRHEDLKQTRKYLGLAINEQEDVQEKRSEYMQRIRGRMKKGLPPEKDFSMRISR